MQLNISLFHCETKPFCFCRYPNRRIQTRWSVPRQRQYQRDGQAVAPRSGELLRALKTDGPVFDRTTDGVVHEFGTTGHLRNSDLIMYDRVAESWWQQFTGEAIGGITRGGS